MHTTTGHDGYDLYLTRLTALVEQHGHAVQYVGVPVIATAADTADAPRDATGAPIGFAYTVGLARHHGWEIALTGVGSHASTSLLNSIARVQPPGHTGTPLIPDRWDAAMARLRPVTHTRHLNQAARFARHHGHTLHTAWQLVLADTNGRFPDNPDCTPPFNRQAEL